MLFQPVGTTAGQSETDSVPFGRGEFTKSRANQWNSQGNTVGSRVHRIDEDVNLASMGLQRAPKVLLQTRGQRRLDGSVLHIAVDDDRGILSPQETFAILRKLMALAHAALTQENETSDVIETG